MNDEDLLKISIESILKADAKNETKLELIIDVIDSYISTKEI